MNSRPLGRSGLMIAPVVFGGNVFGWTIDEPTSFELLDAFVGAGFNGIDTADVYSNWKEGNRGGESETIIGRWLKRTGHRNKVVIATKVGWVTRETGKGLSRDHILRSAEGSLKRLQTDCIDLYQSHMDDPDTPMEETLSAYAELIQKGKVRAIGASNFSSERMSLALENSGKLGLPRYESLQPLYNLYDREGYENQLEACCLKHDLGVIPYSSLRSGFLTGKYRHESDLSKSARGARVVKEFLNDRGRRILAALDRVAAQLECSPARVALAWLLSRPSVTAPIVSATSLKQLEDIVAAPLLKLEPSHVEMLDQASGNIQQAQPA